MRITLALFGAVISLSSCTRSETQEKPKQAAEKQDATQVAPAPAKAALNEPCSGYNCAEGLVCWANAGVCARPCETDADCPDTIKGSPTPVCADKLCVVPCNTAGDCPPSLLCRRVPGRVVRGGAMHPPVTACIATNFGVDSVTGEP